jgi:hypothetical protein
LERERIPSVSLGGRDQRGVDRRSGALSGRTQFSLSELTPEMICGGRVLLNPFSGIASTVLRVQLDGTGQNCEGLLPTMMEQVTLPDGANVPTIVPRSPPMGRANTP